MSPHPISAAFLAAGSRPSASAKRSDKENYAESLSRPLAQYFADVLRLHFPGIVPDEEGRGQESRARTAKGFKRLDVNYSTPELGLGLGVSIKTLNYRDARSRRYTKNFTRVDNELRAEAVDYHVRQPWAVLEGVLFLPLDACDDGDGAPSSFGQAIRIFRHRAGREGPEDPPELFERFFVGLYDFDCMEPPNRCQPNLKLLNRGSLRVGCLPACEGGLSQRGPL